MIKNETSTTKEIWTLVSQAQGSAWGPYSSHLQLMI